jgi:hypothetical protein
MEIPIEVEALVKSINAIQRSQTHYALYCKLIANHIEYNHKKLLQ